MNYHILTAEYAAKVADRDRRIRAEYMAMLAAIQDREFSEDGYTVEDWREYRERTNDEAERRGRP